MNLIRLILFTGPADIDMSDVGKPFDVRQNMYYNLNVHQILYSV